jgi:hypothetical protein
MGDITNKPSLPELRKIWLVFGQWIQDFHQYTNIWGGARHHTVLISSMYQWTFSSI